LLERQLVVIIYTVAMPAPHTHLYDVSVEVDTCSGSTLDFKLPAWTPGSYMIRDYARHVQAFSAQAGEQHLAWHKIDKHTWRVESLGADRVTVRYKVYANELSVRTSHLDASHGYFNGATLAMYLPDRMREPLELRVVTPATWRVATGLEPLDVPAVAGEQEVWRFRAADYDELIDCPCECGTHRSLLFAVDDIPHEIAIWGEGNYDATRLLEDHRRIVELERDLWGSLPYQRYVFILLLVDKGYGGLEHRNSVTNLIGRWSFRAERSYEKFLGLTSHEFFHTWNVKRLRPAPLGSFDYGRENYTRQLWAMEGFTSYYDDLLLVRAGLMTPTRYLEVIAEQIEQLQSQPGRTLQSLEQSSFDAWIKFYRPDENTANSSISYYQKGALVSLLMDFDIRRMTDNDYSLDDLLRTMMLAYPPDGPGIPEERGYQAALEELTDRDWTAFFARYIAGTDELPYAEYLFLAGLELQWSYKESATGTPPAWLGLTTRTEHGRLLVSSVRSDGPAYTSGVYAGDELLALDGWRIDAEGLASRVAERAPGAAITLTLFRRDQLVQLDVPLAPAPLDKLRICPVATPTPQQEALYTSWLGQSATTE
jgi:predicted metalloprotease with PDZ domain